MLKALLMSFQICLGLWAYTVTSTLAVANDAVSQTLSARQSLEMGLFDQAYEQALSHPDSEGLTLAAEIISAKILLGQARKPRKQARKAMRHALKALDINSNNIEAHVQYALAYGFYTRETGSTKAWAKSLPHKCRAAIDKVRTLAPNDPRGEALLASWHIGILVKKSAYANRIYGADEQQALALYASAYQRNPDDYVIGASYIISLAGLNPTAYAGKISQLEADLAQLPINNAAEKIYHQRLTHLASLKSKPKAYKKQAVRWLEGKY